MARVDTQAPHSACDHEQRRNRHDERPPLATWSLPGLPLYADALDRPVVILDPFQVARISAARRSRARLIVLPGSPPPRVLASILTAHPALPLHVPGRWRVRHGRRLCMPGGSGRQSTPSTLPACLRDVERVWLVRWRVEDVEAPRVAQAVAGAPGGEQDFLDGILAPLCSWVQRSRRLRLRKAIRIAPTRITVALSMTIRGP